MAKKIKSEVVRDDMVRMARELQAGPLKVRGREPDLPKLTPEKKAQ
jgi:hypothetical protein